ncbi:MAG TPA: carboxypeptidase-like regulatory domain-containing protein [Bryobacteraceae bacterium]|nr:carboxypeptidase-like regulatory domain-containing protein [Bryobacteraceae bacterium]
MRVVGFSLLLAVASWGAECIFVGPVQHGTIKVAAFDITGALMPRVQVEVLELGTNRVLHKGSSEGRVEGVRFGIYRIRISAPGFYSTERDVRLQEPELILRAQLSLGEECGRQSSSLSGSISGLRTDRELWVKAIPLRGTGGAEAKVHGGYFLISGLDAGEYLVVVLNDKSVLHTEVMRITGDAKLAIRRASR